MRCLNNELHHKPLDVILPSGASRPTAGAFLANPAVEPCLRCISGFGIICAMKNATQYSQSAADGENRVGMDARIARVVVASMSGNGEVV